MNDVFDSPVATDLSGQAGGQSRLSLVAGDEVASSGLLFTGAFVGAAALHTDQVGGVRIVGRIGLNAD